MIIHIDKTIYSDECISKAVYSLADLCVIQRSNVSESEECLHVIPLKADDNKTLESIIYTRLNDYKLRSIIEKETHDIRTILYAKAFSECDDITEDDLD